MPRRTRSQIAGKQEEIDRREHEAELQALAWELHLAWVIDGKDFLADEPELTHEAVDLYQAKTTLLRFTGEPCTGKSRGLLIGGWPLPCGHPPGPHLITYNPRKLEGGSMSPKPRLIVIAKRRPYDEAVWKRLLVAYANALHDRARAQAPTVPATTSEAGGE